MQKKILLLTKKSTRGYLADSYFSHTTPNVAFAMSVVSQFMHQPREVHLRDALRIV